MYYCLWTGAGCLWTNQIIIIRRKICSAHISTLLGAQTSLDQSNEPKFKHWNWILLGRPEWSQLRSLHILRCKIVKWNCSLYTCTDPSVLDESVLSPFILFLVLTNMLSKNALSYTRDDHCLLDTITKSLFVCVYRINCGNLIRWLSFEKTMRSWYKVDLLSTVCIGNFYFPKSWLFDCYSCDCNKPVSCKQLLCVDSFFRV